MRVAANDQTAIDGCGVQLRLEGLDPVRISGPVLSYTPGRMCGVQAMTLTPSDADIWAIAKEVSRSGDPSSTPGIIWQ